MKYTLAFDVYGTLINTSAVFISLEKRIGLQAKQFMENWRNKQLEYSFRRGLMNKYVDFAVCTENALEFCDLTFKTNLSSNDKKDLMREYTVLPAFPDVEIGLKSLKKSGHQLFAFSNGSANAIKMLLENANLFSLFDGIVSVEEVQMFKPSPLVYDYFNTKTKSTKADSCLISSNPFDVIGALEYGMRSAWVQRSPEAIFDPWGIEPTFKIKDIMDLNSALLDD